MHTILRKTMLACLMGAAFAGCDASPSSDQAPQTSVVTLEINGARPQVPLEVEVYTADGWLWDVLELECPPGACVQEVRLALAPEEGPFEYRPASPVVRVTASEEVPSEEISEEEAGEEPGSSQSIGNGPLMPPGSSQAIGNGPLRDRKGGLDG